MPVSGTPASAAQAHLAAGESPRPDLGRDIVVQSRETGDVVPNQAQPFVASPADKTNTQAKPFAHFIAGG